VKISTQPDYRGALGSGSETNDDGTESKRFFKSRLKRERFEKGSKE